MSYNNHNSSMKINNLDGRLKPSSNQKTPGHNKM